MFVQRGALLVIGRGLGCGKGGVIICIAVVDHVLAVVTDPPGQQAAGVEGAGVEADYRRLKVPVAVYLCEPGVPVHLLNLGRDANRLQLLGQNHRGVDMGRIVAGYFDGKFEAVRIAGLPQQLLCLVNVVGIAVGESGFKVFGKGGIHGGADLGAVPVRRQVQHGVHIHSVAHGLPHQNVVKGLHLMV